MIYSWRPVLFRRLDTYFCSWCKPFEGFERLKATEQDKFTTEQTMKILSDTTQKLGATFMHYVCIRSKFRSTVLKDSLLQQNVELCTVNCCPSKA